MTKNPLSVSQLCQHNDVSVVFNSSCFQVKDRRTGATILQGPHKDGVYLRFVDNYFQRKIIILYTDNGGEFTALASFLATHGITHLTTPPHTPEHNSYAERRHRHIVETGLTLLHHASIPLTFRPFAFLC